ncbi:hypothetical protein [Streptomyces sp. NPDC046727]|uniref:hypothetical protein n=1 Tax=Streptomyces sp. NPDC046727 TaxID=3155373 RepID=UPI0034057752
MSDSTTSNGISIGGLFQLQWPEAYPIRPAELAGDPHFPPVANGLDYLVSVVELLARQGESASARSLKYAVLHLAAGAEVLLKARLQIEHWSLVFTHPGQATRKALEDGSLTSCSPDETRQRLTNIVGIEFTAREKTALTELARSRNALQHYGLIGVRANAHTVTSTTVQVLHFLVQFVETHLLPRLDEPELSTARQEMEVVRRGLRHIEGYARERMRALVPQLGPARASTIECPACTQWALVVSDSANVQGREATAGVLTADAGCLFCGAAWTAEEAAADYIEWCWNYRLNGGPQGKVHRCPRCQHTLLVDCACTAAAQDKLQYLCFGCSTAFDDLMQCAHCGGMQIPDEDHVCSPFRSCQP